MKIDDVIDGVIAAEGGYANDPNDKGGETMFGVTVAVARANGYTGAMKAMPRSVAVNIYRKRYVIGPKFDVIGELSMPIAAELVDTGVNAGPKVAATFLQRSLTVLNNGGKDYPDLMTDGSVGPATVFALKAFLARRGALGEKRLVALLNALQGEHYVSLCEGRAANETFMYGWLARIVG